MICLEQDGFTHSIAFKRLFDMQWVFTDSNLKTTKFPSKVTDILTILRFKVVNGRPCLDEMKLLASMLIPELYSTSMY